MRAMLIAIAAGSILIASPQPVLAAEGSLSPGAAASAVPSPRPDLKRAKDKEFPFKPWSYAKAYTYNFFEDRPVQMRVVSDDGKWSEHIRSQQVISDLAAQSAARLAAETRGTIETTKCTFPRHAIVYFDREDKPVASIDVCFDCEAVLAWPDYAKPESYDWERATKRLEKALPRWRQLFGRDLGLPIDYKTAPAP